MGQTEAGKGWGRRFPVDTNLVQRSGALFNADHTARLRLWRTWGLGPCLVVIGLNPSSADADYDDTTVRQCIARARRLELSGLVMLNLFPLVATDPAELGRGDPYAGETPECIETLIAQEWRRKHYLLAAWGSHGSIRGAGPRLREYMVECGIGSACIGVNIDGSPRHPLYTPAAAPYLPYTMDGGPLCTPRQGRINAHYGESMSRLRLAQSHEGGG